MLLASAHESLVRSEGYSSSGLLREEIILCDIEEEIRIRKNVAHGN